MEADLQTDIMDAARERGWSAWKVAAIGRQGFPDVLLVRQGVVVFMEVKNPNGRGRLRPAQIRTVKKLKEQNVNVYVTENLEHAITLLERHHR